jgi:hypothetical protein
MILEHNNSTNKVDATTWPLPQARDLGEVLTTIGGRRQKQILVQPKHTLVGANNKQWCRREEMKVNDVEEKKNKMGCNLFKWCIYHHQLH